MKVIERMVQEIFPGQNEALGDLDKRYDAIEVTLGFPPKTRMWCMSGPYDHNTSVLEREWESMAAMEAAYESSFSRSDILKLGEEGRTIVKSTRMELYYRE